MQSSGAEDRAYPGVTAEAGEQTPLFVVMPSAQSTKAPSLTNLLGFGTLGEQLVRKADDDERSSTSLQIHKPLPKNYGGSGPFYLCRSFLCSLPGKICSAVLIMVIIGLFFGMQSAKKTTANFGFRNPLSTMSPVNDLHVPLIGRPPTTDPPKLIIRKNTTHALPTNIWYLNLMLAGTGQPSSAQNVFTLPYLVDVAGIIPGLHISPQQVGGTMKVVNLIDNPVQGVVLGVAEDATANQWSGSLSKKYTLPADLSSPLAVTLDWVSVRADGIHLAYRKILTPFRELGCLSHVVDYRSRHALWNHALPEGRVHLQWNSPPPNFCSSSAFEKLNLG